LSGESFRGDGEADQRSLHRHKAKFIVLYGRECFFEKQKMVNQKLKHCVYILLSLKDKKLYIGLTSNLKQRLTDHFHGKSLATSFRRPFLLLLCEYFFSKADAMRREKYFKTTAGKKTLKIMLRESLKISNIGQQ
jgi:putative endonuclease